MRCPECDSSAIELCGKRNTFYPIAWLYILGLPFASLHQASSRCDCRCPACGAKFTRRSAVATFALVLLLAGMFCLILGMGIAMLLGLR